MTQRTVRFGDLRMPEIRELVKKPCAAILPIGATEQHANHLPVNFDTHSTVYMAELAAQKVIEAHPDWGCVVVPEVAYADVFGRPVFDPPAPGSLSIGLDTQINLIHDIVASLVKQGFKNVLLMSGHLENYAPIKIALRKVDIEVNDPDLGLYAVNSFLMCVRQWMEICKLGIPGLGHAGERETAMALITQPDSVLIGETYPEAWNKGSLSPKYTAPLCGELVFHASRASGVREAGMHVKDGGVATAEAAVTTKELGQQLIDMSVADLAEILTMMISSTGASHKDINLYE